MPRNEVLEILENVDCPQFHDYQTTNYGKWGALNFNQRTAIKKLCDSWLILEEHDRQISCILENLKDFLKQEMIIDIETDDILKMEYPITSDRTQIRVKEVLDYINNLEKKMKDKDSEY